MAARRAELTNDGRRPRLEPPRYLQVEIAAATLTTISGEEQATAMLTRRRGAFPDSASFRMG